MTNVSESKYLKYFKSIENEDVSHNPKKLAKLYAELSKYIVDKVGHKAINNEYTPINALTTDVLNLRDAIYNLEYDQHPITTMIKYFEYETVWNKAEFTVGEKHRFLFRKTGKSFEFNSFADFISINYESLLEKAITEYILEMNQSCTNSLIPQFYNSIKDFPLEHQLDILTCNKELLMYIDISFLFCLLHYKEILDLKNEMIMMKIHDNLSKGIIEWDDIYYSLTTI